MVQIHPSVPLSPAGVTIAEIPRRAVAASPRSRQAMRLSAVVTGGSFGTCRFATGNGGE